MIIKHQRQSYEKQIFSTHNKTIRKKNGNMHSTTVLIMGVFYKTNDTSCYATVIR